jgi:IclR family mhp operon transcriptional activator
MGRLLQRCVTTPDGDAMIIRETTHRFGPPSFHRSMIGRRGNYTHSRFARIYCKNFRRFRE